MNQDLLRKCRDRLEQMDLELRNEKLRREEIEKQLQEALVNSEKYAGRFEEIRSQHHKLSLEKYELEKCLEASNAQLSPLVEELKHAKKTAGVFENNFLRAESKIEEYSDYILYLESELHNKCLSIDDWAETVDKTENQIQSYSKENQELRNNLEGYELSYKDLKESYIDLENSKLDLQKSYEVLKNKYKNIENECSEIEHKGRFLKDDYDLLADNYKGLQKNYTNLVNEKEILRNRCKILEEENDELENARASLEKEKDHMKEKLEDVQNSLDIHEHKFASKLKASKEEIERLEKDLIQVKSQTEEELKEEIKNKSNKILELTNENTGLKAQIEKLIDTSSTLEQSLVELSEKYSGKDHALRELQEASRKLELSFTAKFEELALEIQGIRDFYRSEIYNVEEKLSRKRSDSIVPEEVQKLKDFYQRALTLKDQEIHVLNQDREKLQEAVQQLYEISNDKKEHMTSSLTDKFEARLRERVQSFHRWRKKLKHEVETLRSPNTNVKAAINRLDSLIGDMNI